MRPLIVAVVLLAAGCAAASAELAAEDGGPQVEPVGVDAGSPVDARGAADTVAPDVVSTRDGGHVGAASDARADVVDAGAASDARADVVDAGAASDAAPDPRPCLDSITVPDSPSWVIRVTYKLSPTTTQSVPYYCPSTVEGNSCKFALGGGPNVYLAPGTCRKAVPAKCLPCTGAVTEW